MTAEIELPHRVNNVDRRKLLAEWYDQSFPAAARFVRVNGGDMEEAKDLFHDAMIICYEKHLNGRFSADLSAKAYLLGIVRHLWFRRVKESYRSSSLEATSGDIPADTEPKLLSEKLLLLLERSGIRCLELLSAFYYERLSMKQIHKRFGYAGERSATVQKYKCIEKIRDQVKNTTLSYEDFFE